MTWNPSLVIPPSGPWFVAALRSGQLRFSSQEGVFGFWSCYLITLRVLANAPGTLELPPQDELRKVCLEEEVVLNQDLDLLYKTWWQPPPSCRECVDVVRKASVVDELLSLGWLCKIPLPGKPRPHKEKIENYLSSLSDVYTERDKQASFQRVASEAFRHQTVSDPDQRSRDLAKSVEEFIRDWPGFKMFASAFGRA